MAGKRLQDMENAQECLGSRIMVLLPQTVSLMEGELLQYWTLGDMGKIVVT